MQRALMWLNLGCQIQAQKQPENTKNILLSVFELTSGQSLNHKG